MSAVASSSRKRSAPEDEADYDAEAMAVEEDFGDGMYASDDDAQAFASMPLDILAEIAGHLDPLTLLHMTRVNKAFRAILMAPSSRSIWIGARRTVDLPDLEADDISEPAYAAFMFEKVCSVCGKDRASIVNVGLRKRFCSKCQKANLNLEAFYWVTSARKDVIFHPYSLLCSLPTSNYYFMPDLLTVNDELFDIQSRIVSAKPKSAYFKGDKSLSPYFEGRPIPVPEGQSEFKPEEAELQAYIESRRALIASAKADAEELNTWLKEGAAGRGRAAEEARKKRREGIFAKIEELGYQKQDLYSWHSDVAKLIDQPRALSDGIWKRISPDIIKHCETNRMKRLQRERQSRQRDNRYKLRPFYELAKTQALSAPGSDADFPGFDSFADFDVLKQFWEPDEPEVLDDESWQTVSDGAIAHAKHLVWDFKIGLAQQLARDLADTDHALDAALTAKLLPPDGDEAWSPTASVDELAGLFKPFKHSFVCSECPAVYSVNTYSGSELWQHREKPYWDHSRNAQSVKGKHLAGWADVAMAALAAVSKDSDTDCETALEALGNKETWTCEGCSEFSEALKAANDDVLRLRKLYNFGVGTLRVGYSWASMLRHLLSTHLVEGHPPSLPKLALADPDSTPPTSPAEEPDTAAADRGDAVPLTAGRRRVIPDSEDEEEMEE
ncbi:hypothetical protein JCM10207_002999 [Rhodosporidiobolus poonsookiae]